MLKFIPFVVWLACALPASAGGISPADPASSPTEGSASAHEAAKFSGFYAGVGLGFTRMDDPQRNYNTFDGGYAGGILNGWEAALGDHSTQISIIVGHDWAFGNLITGLEARYLRHNLDDTAIETLNGEPDPSFTSRMQSSSSRQILARAGYVLGDTALGYIVAGKNYTQYKRTYFGLTSGEDVFSGTDTGTMIGMGYERVINDRWNLRGEISRINFDREINTVVNAYAEDAVHDARQDSLSISLIRRF